MFFHTLIVSSTLLFAPFALAQMGGNVCRGDAQKLCPDAVAARDRDAAKICLLKQIDKVTSPECQAKLKEAQSK